MKPDWTRPRACSFVMARWTQVRGLRTSEILNEYARPATEAHARG
jgi:hypothetical protein